jgi:hypothetical protein
VAKPRVFISSTFYDLRQVREDIERMIRELGYEPVRHETGAIPYTKHDAPESSAYREVELSDIIVTIIGGRFGAESKEDPGYSVTQVELRRALENGSQVFIFVEKSVLAEFSTYEMNKEHEGVRYRFVDDIRVYKFLEEIYALPRNNPIAPFETGRDIAEFLRQQFAGLFHRFLQDQQRVAQLRVFDEINGLATTLRELVAFLKESKNSTHDSTESILLANHPMFHALSSALGIRYRIYFSNRNEFRQLMKARAWKPVPKDSWDKDSVDEWVKGKEYIKFLRSLFDGVGRVALPPEAEWEDGVIQVKPTPETDAEA